MRKRRQTELAIGRLLTANSLEELFRGSRQERSLTFMILADLAGSGENYRAVAQRVAQREGVTYQYLLDRVMVFVASISEIRKRDLFRRLGVPPAATLEEIRKRWRKLVKEVHPDASGGNSEAFLRVRAAYETLADPDRRARYEGYWSRQVAPVEEAAILARGQREPRKRLLTVKSLKLFRRSGKGSFEGIAGLFWRPGVVRSWRRPVGCEQRLLLRWWREAQEQGMAHLTKFRGILRSAAGLAARWAGRLRLLAFGGAAASLSWSREFLRRMPTVTEVWRQFLRAARLKRALAGAMVFSLAFFLANMLVEWQLSVVSEVPSTVVDRPEKSGQLDWQRSTLPVRLPDKLLRGEQSQPASETLSGGRRTTKGTAPEEVRGERLAHAVSQVGAAKTGPRLRRRSVAKPGNAAVAAPGARAESPPSGHSIAGKMGRIAARRATPAEIPREGIQQGPVTASANARGAVAEPPGQGGGRGEPGRGTIDARTVASLRVVSKAENKRALLRSPPARAAQRVRSFEVSDRVVRERELDSATGAMRAGEDRARIVAPDVTRSEAVSFLERFRRTYERLDATALTRLFVQDASENSLAGRPRITAAYRDAFASLEAVRYRMGKAEVRPLGAWADVKAPFIIAYRERSGRYGELRGRARWWLVRDGRNLKVLRLEYEIEGRR